MRHNDLNERAKYAAEQVECETPELAREAKVQEVARRITNKPAILLPAEVALEADALAAAESAVAKPAKAEKPEPKRETRGEKYQPSEKSFSTKPRPSTLDPFKTDL